MTLCALLLLALTRAEIVQRMRAPVITQTEGLVRVYADCPEDVRREFQHPVASFAADTAAAMYRGFSMKPVRFASPGVIVHIGDVRTNDTRVISKVSRSEGQVVTRIYLKNPATADLPPASSITPLVPLTVNQAFDAASVASSSSVKRPPDAAVMLPHARVAESETRMSQSMP